MERTRAQILTATLVLAATTSLVGGCHRGPGTAADAPSGAVESALADVAGGNLRAAILELQAVLTAHPLPDVAARANLLLGNLLLRDRRGSEALAPLREAARGSQGAEYAQLMFARATVDANQSAAAAEAESMLAALLARPADVLSPVVREDATFLGAQLAALQRKWPEVESAARSYLVQWPQGDSVDDARWLLAEALRNEHRDVDAHSAYADLWYGNPGAPRAVDARDAMREIERSAGVAPRRLGAEEHYAFVQALRAAGLHEDALDELRALLTRYPRHPKRDGALLLRAMSLYSLRRNDDCVRTVEQLIHESPRSSWVPAAVVYAIKANRRGEATNPEVERWTRWVREHYPRHPKTFEARYDLGVHLANTADPQRGLDVLAELVAEAGNVDPVPDALWKMAWIEHRLGRDRDAVAALERLTTTFPKSGFRKAALYWQGRFTSAWDTARAAELFRACYREFPRDYYGQHARENLIAMHQAEPTAAPIGSFPPIDLLGNESARPDLGPAYRRAARLAALGLYDYSARELGTVPAAQTDPSLQFALAFVDSRSGNTWRAIDRLERQFKEALAHAAIDDPTVPRRVWTVLYPLNYRTDIEKAVREAGLSNVDPMLVAAVIRMESKFLPSAISPVGAIGLMQLMPDTAAKIAAERGLGSPSRADLFEPVTNIRYGTFYLAQRERDFGGDWFPAICSYNAGVGPVRSWWEKRPVDQQIDEFVETIPFVDTRLYVKQILADYESYKHLYGEGAG